MSNTSQNNILEILYEDNHLIAINKHSGVLVQGDKTGDTSLLEIVKNHLKVTYNKPGNVFLGLCHRLDRPTSGVIVFAKTSKALTRLNQMFKDGDMQKTYWAVVSDHPEPTLGILINYLLKNQEKNKSFVVDKSKKGASKAELHYETIKNSDRYFLVEVTPKTGRHHQIRVQLSNIGYPIKGDLKYGAKRSNPDGSIHLHARKLSFIHPVSKEAIEIIAPTPDEVLWNFFDK